MGGGGFHRGAFRTQPATRTLARRRAPTGARPAQRAPPAKRPRPPPTGPTPLPRPKRCGGGDFDSIKHALDLFLDVISLFVRIVVILLRSAEKREDEGRRRRGRRGRDD